MVFFLCIRPGEDSVSVCVVKSKSPEQPFFFAAPQEEGERRHKVLPHYGQHDQQGSDPDNGEFTPNVRLPLPDSSRRENRQWEQEQMLSAEKEIITKKAKTCRFQHDICLVSAQLISVLKFNSVRETVTNESLLMIIVMRGGKRVRMRMMMLTYRQDTEIEQDMITKLMDNHVRMIGKENISDYQNYQDQ